MDSAISGQSNATSEISERVLLLDANQADRELACSTLREYFPTSRVQAVSDLAIFRSIIGAAEFDLVVIDTHLADVSAVELLHELRCQDNAPVVLVTSAIDNTEQIARLYGAGCQKCIIKHGDWTAELGPAARQLFRMRKLVEENTTLIAKLTEANVLLEEKNRRLDDFSATLAHDIRGPLGGISMKLDYVLETYGGELPPRVSELLKRSYSSVHRLTDIVQAMYEYAKLGRQAAKMTEIKLRELAQEVIGDLHYDERLDIQIGIGDLPSVWGSPDLLRRVFINLINNAVKYCDKSPIIINLGVERYVDSSLARFAEVYVEDNGPGIAEREQREIFQMFARGAQHLPEPQDAAQSGARSGNLDGLGIGLAVVQRIVELHFGRIWVRSTPGKGARFVLSLPQERIDFIGG